MTHRVAVLDQDLCQPQKCGLECIKYCPVNKSGAECVTINEESKKPKSTRIFVMDVEYVSKYVHLMQ